MRSRESGQRAILQVRWGPMAFRKAVLEPGQVLRVGRDEATDFALPHDSLLGGMHFELAWNGSKCRIRDMKTMTGTLVDGKRIKESIVPHGGWIRAGGTDFVAYVERHMPPSDPSGGAEALQSGNGKHQALSVLSTQEGLYAVLDTARSERILTLLRESVEEHRSLYEGPQGAALADVAPYLVQLPKGSKLLESLVQEGWGKYWGVYITSASSLTETRRHLRKFLMVDLEGYDGRFYFRFYDPRVLQTFLATIAPIHQRDFFGPIARFIHEGPDNTCESVPASR
jgi:pSer/pThr/pTyr-binding forkhead associated (FHA) protein